MTKVYLLIGGNLGNRIFNISSALELIGQKIGRIIIKSSIYETEPWGFKHNLYFLNQAIIVETNLSADSVLKQIKIIEAMLGRLNSTQQYASRNIDIDILFYNNMILKKKTLVIPHNKLHLRSFVLTPLYEIAPDLIHPVFNKTINELKAECKDSLKVHKVYKVVP